MNIDLARSPFDRVAFFSRLSTAVSLLREGGATGARTLGDGTSPAARNAATEKPGNPTSASVPWNGKYPAIFHRERARRHFRETGNCARENTPGDEAGDSVHGSSLRPSAESTATIA